MVTGSNPVGRARTSLEFDIEEFKIPGWPPYGLRVSDMQVVSYHSGKAYDLKRIEAGNKYHANGPGYCLFYHGGRGFITLTQLNEIVQKERNMLKASQRGGLKTGDLIVGSVLKSGGSTLSTTADPVVHANLSAAKTEAARLAGIDKTKKYVVLEVKGLALVNDVNWE